MGNKFDKAIGYFWGASLFIGALVAAIMGFAGNMSSDWVQAIITGFLVFLILGLAFSGVVTLFKKK